MKRLPVCCLVLLLACTACNDTATTDTPAAKTDSPTVAAGPAPTPPPTVDSATAEKNRMDYMTPGDAHAQLAKSNGKWNAEISMSSAPGAPPEVSKGTCVNRMVLGGRYQVGEFKGTMMGQPFEGISTVGYDKHKNLYESTWIDNAGTGVSKMTGTWDEATKTIHFTGKMMDAMTKQETDMKETFKIVDDNTQVMEMFYTGPDGKEVKVMEIKYTRAK